MKYVILTLLILLIIFLFSKKKAKGNTPSDKSEQEDHQSQTGKQKENRYTDLRNLAFTATAEKLNLNLPENQTVVYGTIMDWDYKGVTVTVIAFQTGDASLYLSSGQMFIGGVGHESVRNSAIDLVSASQEFIGKAEKTTSTALADKECTRFYFLTNKGMFMYQEKVTMITQPTNEWSKLFNQAQNVITQYRLVSGNR